MSEMPTVDLIQIPPYLGTKFKACARCGSIVYVPIVDQHIRWHTWIEKGKDRENFLGWIDQ